MSRRVNWDAVRMRNSMRIRGTESVKEEEASVLSLLPKSKHARRRPKADMRAEAERLVAEFLAKRK